MGRKVAPRASYVQERWDTHAIDRRLPPAKQRRPIGISRGTACADWADYGRLKMLGISRTNHRQKRKLGSRPEIGSEFFTERDAHGAHQRIDVVEAVEIG